MEYLKIAGKDVSKYIKSLSITHEPVWSSNSGRTLDATFTGDIVARKWKLQVATKPLTQSESAEIVKQLELSPFMNIGFIPTNGTTDNIITVKMYSNEPANVVYSYNKNLIRYESLTFNLIEQ